MKYNALVVSVLAIAASLSAQAASVPNLARQEQWQQAREADAARTERLKRPTVTVEGIRDERMRMPSTVAGGPSFYL